MIICLKIIDSVPETENSLEFHQKMVDRMSMSFFKYGAIGDAYPSKVDAMASLALRLKKYEETGNTEWLVDLANIAMIEFMHPKHPKAHFRATSSQESPGRVWNPDEIDSSVEISNRANDGTPQ